MSTTGKLTKIKKLGEGAYGTVYQARYIHDGTVVALKRMNLAAEDEGVPATTIREICLLKELSHPNIVRLQDVMFQPPKLTLVFDCCAFDLKHYCDRRERNLDHEEEILHIMWQIVSGMAHMHRRGIVHRDMKPQNVLVNLPNVANDPKIPPEEGGPPPSDRVLPKQLVEVKLADFGLARVEGIPVKKYSHEAVTLWYRAPDVILGSNNYGLTVDVWSVGCIYAELALGHPLFPGQSDEDQLVRMFKFLGTPSNKSWPSIKNYPNLGNLAESKAFTVKYTAAIDDIFASTGLGKLGEKGLDLLRRLLVYEPRDRITMEEALVHPVFDSYKARMGITELRNL